ncbi:MAG: FeoB-associated Cys-rich membrane protein [Candidatus Hydrogenedentes bacterium]|nr:FeoB-associated Cys-rich membrane protein [Candidatus Hydrogenedentota bacterium]
MLELLITLALVLIAAIYVARFVYRSLSGKGGACGSCGKCGDENETASPSSPEEHIKPL